MGKQPWLGNLSDNADLNLLRISQRYIFAATKSREGGLPHSYDPRRPILLITWSKMELIDWLLSKCKQTKNPMVTKFTPAVK